jgi:arylsulfatase
LYVLDDELRFVHNDGRGHLRHLSGGTLATGTRQVAARLDAVGKGVWNLALDVDGTERSQLADVPLLYGIAPFEGIDVGIDRRSPVSWELYERFGAFPYTGSLHAVTYTPGEDAPDSPGNLLDIIRSMGAKFE